MHSMTTTPSAGAQSPTRHEEGTTDGPMSHAQIMRALSGLLLGLFCSILSSTVVTNALPRLISDLGGGQSAYTWVVTSSLLAVTASTPYGASSPTSSARRSSFSWRW
jgi:MFS family permease